LKISADGHCIEPATLWQDRLPESERDFGPRYVYRDGLQTYVVGGKPWLTSPRFHRANGDYIDDKVDRRLDDLERDGVGGELLHANLGLTVWALSDPDLQRDCAQIYNDYLTENYVSHRDRFIPMALIPVLDIPEAVSEIDRVAALGFLGIELPMMPPPGTRYHDPDFEPVWEAVNRHGMHIAMHAATGVWLGDVRPPAAGVDDGEVDPLAGIYARTAGAPTSALGEGGPVPVIASLLAGGMFERYPDVHVIFVETGAGWLAHTMWSMDMAWRGPGIGQQTEDNMMVFHRRDESEDAPTEQSERFPSIVWPYALRPSDYIRRQVHVTFMDDPAAVAFRHVTGVAALLWGNDYPHAEGTWPQSEDATNRLFAGVSEDERAAILGGTLAGLFGQRTRA
jgi:predicted TIM-barrel fold metal-dependent hydrolase